MQEGLPTRPVSLTSSVVIVNRVDGALLKSDRAAVGLAIRQFGNEVCVDSPDCDEVALRYALAAGATRVVTLDDFEANVYVFGRGGAGPSGDLLPARLALSRSAHLILEVLEFRKQADGLLVVRDLGRGSREILKLSFPVVMVISDDAAIPNYVSRYRQMRVTANLPTRALTKPDTSKSMRWRQLRPRTKTAEFVKKTAGNAKDRMFSAFGLADDSLPDTNAQHVISADPETCASQLVRYLAHHGFVDSRFFNSGSAPSTCPDVAPNEQDLATEVRLGGMQNHSSTATISSRVPRTLSGPLPGMARRPRPFRPIAPHQSKLARRPRPLGQPQPENIRGPFPVQQNSPE